MTAATPAERKARERARKRQAGLEEVRGIYAPPDRHDDIKSYAAHITQENAMPNPKRAEMQAKHTLEALEALAEMLAHEPALLDHVIAAHKAIREVRTAASIAARKELASRATA